MLPDNVNPADLKPDPGNRPNHWWHPPTDAVFHLPAGWKHSAGIDSGTATAAAEPPPPVKAAAEPGGEPDAQETEPVKRGPGRPKKAEEPDAELLDLRAQAKAAGVPVADDADKVTIRKVIEMARG